MLAVVASTILAICAPLSQRLQMDRTINQMFAADDPTLVAYEELRSAFGGNAAVLLVYHDKELMTPAGIQRAREISTQVAKVPGVRGVLSPAQVNDLLGYLRPLSPGSSNSKAAEPLLDSNDLIVKAFDRLFSGYTHSQDHQWASVVALLDAADPQQGHRLVVRNLRSIADKLPDGASQAELVGEPVLLAEGFDLIERDGLRLALWTLAILSPLVLLLLRGWRWAILQAMVITWSVVVTRATLDLLGMRLSLVSSILTAICTVIAVTSIIHLGMQWRVRRNRADRPERAALNALTMVMPPIFWACATDAAGFLSLVASSVAPIRDFGIMMGVASMAVWIAILCYAPICLHIGTRHSPVQPLAFAARLENSLRRFSVRAAYALTRQQTMTLAVTAIVTLMALLGVGRMQIETSFLKNFRDDSDIADAYRLVENTLEGAGVWDVVLDAPVETTTDYLKHVRKLESRLRDIEVSGAKLTKVLSLADVDGIVTVLPLMRVAPTSVRLAGFRTAIPAFSDALLSAPEAQVRKCRIMLRSKEHLSAEAKLALISKVESVVREETQSQEWQQHFADTGSSQPGRITGYYVMIARLVSQLLRDQWRCFAIAAILVWLLLAAATRSWTLATLALLPNLLPILIVLGALGWSGGRMNMGAAMIAAVSIGMSIDGSVHYLASYQAKLRRGRSRLQAAMYAQRGIGLPVIFATVALMTGFLAIARSEFVPTATFGILTACSLVIGSAINLLLLPVLITLGPPGLQNR